MLDIKSMTLQELEAVLTPKFRAKQVFDWLHNKLVLSFDEMTNLPKSMIEDLKSKYYITLLEEAQVFVSKIDGTKKYLFKLLDGEYVETVRMHYNHGDSVCVSTQVGCKMGCTFCASTKAGFKRNLTASEILEQIYHLQREEKVSSIVLMGIGEPLDNFDNVMRFLELLSNPNGMNMSLRHISLSTCGLVDKIYELADKKLQLTLSISLHAPNNQVRDKTMPVNHKYKIEELLKACKYYTQKTSRRISFEYALIKGVNDSVSDAKELAQKLKGILCHVNLINVNEIKQIKYYKSPSANKFIEILSSYGITATLRRTLGADINAACGQLRATANSKEE
ncbi:MAG: 23S rRNA (adenine(2503)-C(2))-methyltransferase RlmN [Oscillospiraceae bacterium]